MITLTDDNFMHQIVSSGIILVDFWAEWCGPCKKMLPILEEIDAENDSFDIGKLNVDDNPVKSQQFNISSIPTMILFKGGKPVHTIIGAKPKHVILKEIEEWI
jgi:thioredoxin 1